MYKEDPTQNAQAMKVRQSVAYQDRFLRTLARLGQSGREAANEMIGRLL